MPISAGESVYYACSYRQEPGSPPLEMRFMLNTRSNRAFRIDTPVARAVKLFVSDSNDITLVDYLEMHEILVTTIWPDGTAVLSRHRLPQRAGTPVKRPLAVTIGEQYFGSCFQEHDTAMQAPIRVG